MDLSFLLKPGAVKGPERKKGAEGLITDYRNEPQEGLDEVRKMIASDPENLDLQDWLAFMLYSNGEWDEALEVYKRLLAASYRSAHQHLYIGNCYYKKGLRTLAIENWKKAASLDEGSIGRKAEKRLAKALEEDS